VVSVAVDGRLVAVAAFSIHNQTPVVVGQAYSNWTLVNQR